MIIFLKLPMANICFLHALFLALLCFEEQHILPFFMPCFVLDQLWAISLLLLWRTWWWKPWRKQLGRISFTSKEPEISFWVASLRQKATRTWQYLWISCCWGCTWGSSTNFHRICISVLAIWMGPCVFASSTLSLKLIEKRSGSFACAKPEGLAKIRCVQIHPALTPKQRQYWRVNWTIPAADPFRRILQIASRLPLVICTMGRHSCGTWTEK